MGYIGIYWGYNPLILTIYLLTSVQRDSPKHSHLSFFHRGSQSGSFLVFGLVVILVELPRCFPAVMDSTVSSAQKGGAKNQTKIMSWWIPINHWFPLIRPKIRAGYFLGGGGVGGVPLGSHDS